MLLTKQKTVGIRVPDHPASLDLVRELGHPILSTSANPSGVAPLGDPDEIEKLLGPMVDVILDAGPLPHVPSTVVSLVGDNVEVLREGAGPADFFREL
jgi:tRNA threonylcarbamoyl adenosine modification protein (Sua5/YciO/YrdC/YwlC family)